MVILDQPYVSVLLQNTIIKHNIPVLIEDGVHLPEHKDMPCMNEKNFFQLLDKKESLLYTNSENAISKLYKNLPDSSLTNTTRLLKDKYEVRQQTKNLYPNFIFNKLKRMELASIQAEELRFPLVLKPAVGFFSMGVYKLDNYEEWQNALSSINRQTADSSETFPDYVVSQEDFLLEEYIEGEEFAIDAYYNQDGQIVIMNILSHLFAGSSDTSDRIYYTSKNIIKKWYPAFKQELQKIGDIFNLRKYPVHVEFRIKQDNSIIPIEINPLRFAGWCTTDLAWHAYGINTHEYFLLQKEPDWEKILEGKDDTFYYINVADINASIDRNLIKEIDYKKFSSLFNNVLELRKVDYRQYPVFAFVFAKTANYSEMQYLLEADLSKYLVFDY